ncbi:SLC13 family permease [Candidatus Contendibacter odensensis]|uniref:Citrate transporter n=1 Tax=Candidatus Contendobacter odensis Run_B_J11 TaxID=1400861 RepID=A0A7U7GBZ5_9GAMM|nr:SLC13 family permease [Candidatus Contendobacter odensis]CDH45535.1 Citrate transporter [Candidatus Contendobacter odensis Run_B_J11]
MTDFQIYLTIGVFVTVILLIAFDLIDMTVTALLGVSVLIVFGILDGSDLMPIVHTAGGPLSLLFGGMVVARVIGKTGIFEWIGDAFLRATGGSGKRLLLLIVALVAPLCAVLPNATAVILVAPVIVGVCQALKVDFVGPLIITAIVSNAAGMLTLVGDPATFLVGQAIGLSFIDYLRMVSLGGVLAVLAVVPLLPWLLPKIWATRVTLPAERPPITIERPGFLALALFVLLIMVALFLVGESLPTRIIPPQVAIIGAALALLVVYGVRIEPVGEVIRDVDWKTILFLGAIFTLVQAFIKTELLQGLSIQLYHWFGSDLMPVAFLSLAGIGILSSLLANIPVVAAALVMITGYLVAAQAVPEIALAPGFTDWPNVTLPVFVAMMFGGTLGGNATLIGASANVVAVGICAAQGQRVSFIQFLRIGLPIAVVQLSVGALYVLALAAMLG